VVIVLAASFITSSLLAENTGVQVPRLAISLGLVALTQLPTAILYARREARTLTSSEGWVFGFTFVSITLVFEAGLQLLAQQSSPEIDLIFRFLAGSDWQVMFIALSGFVLGIILAAFVFKTLFRLSTRNNLAGEAADIDTRWMENLKWVKSKPTITKFQPRHPKHDYAKLFRHILIGSNAAVLSLGIVFSGPAILEILTLSIPTSIFFAIIVVANQLAKTEPNASMLKRCWGISMEMLPLTIMSFMLLGFSDIYLAYLQSNNQAGQFVTDLSSVFVAQAVSLADILFAATNLATFFAASLFANAGLLLLFTRLIKPLVIRSNTRKRPQIQPLKGEHRLPGMTYQTPANWIPRSPEILAVLKRAKGSVRNKPAVLLLGRRLINTK